MGAKTRAWLVFGTFLQALFTMAAALAIWQSREGSIGTSRGDLAWSNALSYVAVAFISASLGLQGIMGKRVNTQFATTSMSSYLFRVIAAHNPDSRPYNSLVRADG
jgi:hypothetical protein